MLTRVDSTLAFSFLIKSRSHPLSTCAKFSEKLTFVPLPLIRTRRCAYQGVRNVSFSEDFVHVLNG